MPRKKTDMTAAESLIRGMPALGAHGQTPVRSVANDSVPSGGRRADGKRRRINMAFTDDNMDDMQIAASAMGVSQTELVNRVLRDWFDAHERELGVWRAARDVFPNAK